MAPIFQHHGHINHPVAATYSHDMNSGSHWPHASRTREP